MDNGVCEARSHGFGGIADLSRLHELRRPRSRQSCLEHRRGGEPAIHPAGSRRRHSISSTRLTGIPSAAARRSSAGQSRTSPAATRSSSRPKSMGACGRVRTAAGCHARRSCARSMTACSVSAPITSISIRSTAGITAHRSRRPSRRCTTSSRPGRHATSSMHAWQFARALAVSERHGWTRFVSMQNLVNLLYREEEREMLPLCAAEGIGVIPWSPQARGRLTRDWDYTSIRTETDDAHQRLFGRSAEADRKVVDRVAEVAKARGIPRAQVALAWLLAKPVITAPIVGATKLHHLDDALASVNVKLSAEEITSLEEPYVPHAVVGFV